MANLDPPFRAPEAELLSVVLQWMPQSLEGTYLRDALEALVRAGLDALPLPGSGRTLQRWQALAAVAASDLSLIKLFEGHTDALAILRELHGPTLPLGATCGTWAAESGPDRLRLVGGEGEGNTWQLEGRKRWCSGAPLLSHALVTAWDDTGQRLALVRLDQPGVQVTSDGWQAVGMAACASVDVLFSKATAVPVGQAGDYVQRPGFWHGGAGIAACWYGAAVAIAAALHRQAALRPNPHLAAHLGVLDARLHAARALLVQAATGIDEQPGAHAEALALRVRSLVEMTAREVIDRTAKALGAAAFCKDARLARLLADLPVYLSQSHAERDWAQLGTLTSSTADPAWAL